MRVGIRVDNTLERYALKQRIRCLGRLCNEGSANGTEILIVPRAQSARTVGARGENSWGQGFAYCLEDDGDGA